MTGEVPAVTDATFVQEVLDSELPVAVDFWAPWCGPCKMIAPMLAQIGADNPEKLRVVKVNVDENPQTAREYAVQSVPTVSVFVAGKVAKIITGGKSRSMLMKELAEFLG